jgi:tetratricopeptide (TPR) repeat protein
MPDDLTQEQVVEAEQLKSEGTDLFKKKNFQDAISKYESALEKLNSTVDSDDEPEEEEEAAADQEETEIAKKTSELVQACHLNCAICYIKQKDAEAAVSSATKVLVVNAAHVKALYWRGKAYHQLNKLDKAKKDLFAAAKLDPTNKATRAELKACTDKLKVLNAKAKAKQKKKAGFLSGGDCDMYGEKQDLDSIKAANAKKKRQEEDKKRKEEAKEAAKKKKAAKPTKSNFNPGDANDYSKWDNLSDSEEEEEQEEVAPVVKKAEPPKPKPKRQSKKAESDSDDEEVDIAKLGGVKGYKTLADGRKTTFFNREMTEQEKNLIGDITPKALTTPDKKPEAASTTSNSGGSVWNQAGTFEERDHSAWCKKSLEGHLVQAQVDRGAVSLTVTAVKDLEGDGSMCVIRGSKRYIFDFSFTLEWQATLAGGKKAKGKLSYCDCDNDCTESGEFEVEVGWKKITSEQRSQLQPIVGKAGTGLQEAVVAQIRAFVAEFRASF